MLKSLKKSVQDSALASILVDTQSGFIIEYNEAFHELFPELSIFESGNSDVKKIQDSWIKLPVDQYCVYTCPPSLPKSEDENALVELKARNKQLENPKYGSPDSIGKLQLCDQSCGDDLRLSLCCFS